MHRRNFLAGMVAATVAATVALPSTAMTVPSALPTIPPAVSAKVASWLAPLQGCYDTDRLTWSCAVVDEGGQHWVVQHIDDNIIQYQRCATKAEAERVYGGEIYDDSDIIARFSRKGDCTRTP